MKDYASANPECPEFFSRSNVSARSSCRALIGGLKGLHTRQGLLKQCGLLPSSVLSLAQSSPGVSVHPQAVTGVSIDFIVEVSRFVRPTLSVTDLIKTILDVASKSHKSNFQNIPGLVHAKYKGPADFVVSLDSENTTYHSLVRALKQHAETHSTEGRPNPMYWLGCFATNRHDPFMTEAEARILSAQSAANTAFHAVLLLNESASALKQCWPMLEVMWVVKERGTQALSLLPCGHEASMEHIMGQAGHALEKLTNLTVLQFPCSAADQWHARWQLSRALSSRGISMESFLLWSREAVAVGGIKSMTAQLEQDSSQCMCSTCVFQRKQTAEAGL
ncbi:hypothetical protein CEUSTIGMA_g1635.t1 [Chlamydomonas eustigma]|uniref:Uncharacterized protein n=1 Tax=Chlamydomonas eustigma TaxID=1157962 RepID=A0A250WTV8_9CHLO|nr:hypothetical protein CEUSTIGMA_g1635.t1 [Chlamydomonas eustigma]|eukprot:GAX74186.1 hypothetical protein CEUSTIGMA_g1635.t1 [Chlamydomonas eustigma]